MRHLIPSLKLPSFLMAAMIAGAFTWVVPADAAPLITNGSFEIFNPSDFNGPGYGLTDTSIPGWTGAQFVGFVRTGINGTGGGGPDSTAFANNGVIPDGSHVAFMQAYLGYASLSQDVTGLIDGTSYKLNFYVNARDYAPVDTQFLSVTLGSVTLMAATPYNPVQSVGSFTLPYYSVEIPFTYHSVNGSNLSFITTGSSSDVTMLLDGVAITPVPEPSTVALGAIGLVGFLWRARRRKA